MTNTITPATTTSSSSTSSKSSNANDTPSAVGSDFDTFLKMLTVQMQNQDPLNPIDSTDYATQLATFSSVEQAVLTNDLLEDLSAQLGLMGFSQLSGWVGMEARSEEAAYFDGSSISIKSDPASAADKTVLVVRDSKGNVVQQVTMDPTSDVVEWAGVDDDGDPFKTGLYRFELENYSGETYLSTTSVETYSRIVEARFDGGSTILVLEGGNEIDSDSVTALRDPS